jgi:hypothetical protein
MAPAATVAERLEDTSIYTVACQPILPPLLTPLRTMSKLTAPKPVWFLPRTRDRPVVSAIRLGDIIESPWTPEEALNDKPPPPIRSALLRRLEETSWSWIKETEQSRGGGIFASFMQFTGIGGDIEGTRSSMNIDIYAVNRMLTEEFLPNNQYLERSIQDAGIRDVFVGPCRKSEVYMVTGLKTAYGATKATEMMKKRDIHAQVGFDATPLGVPISLGPKGHWSSSVAESLTADKSDFVFAFKLRRLKFKKGVLTGKAFDRGAQYGLAQESDDDDDDEDDLNVGDFSVEDMEEDSAQEFMMQSKTVNPTESGGEEVRVFYPS